MTSHVTDQGYVLTTQEGYFGDLVVAMQNIFGPSLNLQENTLDGMNLNIFAQSLFEADQTAMYAYNSLNPAMATGLALSRLALLLGINRLESQPSSVTLTFDKLQPNSIIPAKTQVADVNEISVFETDEDVNTGDITYTDTGLAGPISIFATAKDNSTTLSAGANVLTKLLTPFGGFTPGTSTVTNQTAALIGRDLETDADLRARMRQVTSLPGTSTLDAMLGALLLIPGVLSARIYENMTATTDVHGIPAHSIQVIVQGGTDIDVANMIWIKMPPCGLFGSKSVVVKDSSGFDQTILFDRPQTFDVDISITLRKTPKAPANVDDIITKSLVQYGLKNLLIGVNVMYFSMICPIQSLDGVEITDFKIAKHNETLAQADIQVNYNELAVIKEENIKITDIQVQTLAGEDNR